MLSAERLLNQTRHVLRFAQLSTLWLKASDSLGCSRLKQCCVNEHIPGVLLWGSAAVVGEGLDKAAAKERQHAGSSRSNARPVATRGRSMFVFRGFSIVVLVWKRVGATIKRCVRAIVDTLGQELQEAKTLIGKIKASGAFAKAKPRQLALRPRSMLQRQIIKRLFVQSNSMQTA